MISLHIADLIGLGILISLTFFLFFWSVKTYSDLYKENQMLRDEIVRIIAERHAIDEDYVRVIPSNTNK